jgi:hypothetical protein
MGIVAFAAIADVIGGYKVCASAGAEMEKFDIIGYCVGSGDVENAVIIITGSVAFFAFTIAIGVLADMVSAVLRAARRTAMTTVATVGMSRLGVVTIGAAGSIQAVMDRKFPFPGDILAAPGADSILVAIVVETSLGLDQFRTAGGSHRLLTTASQNKR